jgi:hypothetical protein
VAAIRRSAIKVGMNNLRIDSSDESTKFYICWIIFAI